MIKSSTEAESNESSGFTCGTSTEDSEGEEEHYKSKKKSNKGQLADLVEVMQLSNAGTPAIELLKGQKQDAKEWFRYFDRYAKSLGWSDRVKLSKCNCCSKERRK